MILYLTGLVKDDYHQWQRGNIIIFKSGTGTGKTTFCIEVLAIYCIEIHEKIIYVCNRTKLEENIKNSIREYEKAHSVDLSPYITVTKYQNLEQSFKDNAKGTKKFLDSFKYIFLDECHYFMSDAPINPYTEILYKYFRKNTSNVMIYASATADMFFDWLIKKKNIPDANVYTSERDYSFVDEVVLYNKELLIPLVESIIFTDHDAKIVIFCASGDRIMDIYRYFGDKVVDVYCSSNYSDKRVRELRNRKAIEGCTFQKQILLTTSVIDNGIDLKDRAIKHVITEMITLDGIIQSLGRKRVDLDDKEDHCKYYIRNYEQTEITHFFNDAKRELDIVNLWRTDKAKFIEKYKHDRKVIKFSKILWPNIQTGNISINQIASTKIKLNLKQFEQMMYVTFARVLINYLPDVLKEKVHYLKPEECRDDFLDYLVTIEDKSFYKDDFKFIKEKFKSAMSQFGKKSKRYGIDTLNDFLDERYGDKYSKRFYTFRDNRRKLENGEDNPNRNKMYITLN